MEEFVQKHLELIEQERQEEVAQGLSLLSTDLKNIKELETKGVCLSKLEVESERVGLFGRRIVTLSRHFGRYKLPTHSITCGDIVGIFSKGQSLLPRQLVSGVVVKSSDVQLGVAFEELPEEVSLSGHGDCLQVVKLANDVTYKRMKRALNDLKSMDSILSSHLVDVLFEATPPGPSHSKWTNHLDQLQSQLNSSDFKFFNQSLDNSQKRAVLFALSRPDVAIIHGPPGTGKTTTVIEYILQETLTLNNKVLAVAPSNIAVDNLVERLAASSPKLKIIRLGHPARLVESVLQYSLDSILASSHGSDIVLDVRKEMSSAWSKAGSAKSSIEKRKWRTEAKALKKELIEREEKLVQQILSGANVILATNTGATPTGPLKHLPNDHFDVVVIDECAQSLEASCWIPLSRAPKCILAGDHKQLPPTILSDKAARDGLAVTLMERLVPVYRDQVTTLLTTQYRMNHDIMKWPSQYLYEDSLTAHESVSRHLLKDLPTVTITTATTVPLLFIDTAGCGLYELDTPSEESKGNEGEAEIVLAHVKDLLAAGLREGDIAIIAPYHLQVGMIRERLETSGISTSKVEVHTVDGFQGREKEAVIISFTRSNKKGEFGFLKEQRRTNVAVTRARRHLAMIGDSETISREPFIKGLLEYCTNNGEVCSAHEYIQTASMIQAESVATIQQDSFTKKPMEEMKKKVPQSLAVDNKLAQQRLSYEKQLKELKNSIEEQSRITFSNTLSSSQRKIIHELSEELGLSHVSHGEGNDRYIVVSKSVKTSAKTSADECSDSMIEDGKIQQQPLIKAPHAEDTVSVNKESIGNEDTVSVNKESIGNDVKEKKVLSKVASLPPASDAIAKMDVKSKAKDKEIGGATGGMWQCQICGIHLPEGNSELHQLRCEREKRRVEDIIKKKKQESEMKSKSLQKKTKSEKTKPVEQLDDLDLLLEEMKKADKTCNFSGCKKSVNHLEIICPFCHKKYCMMHNTAETHGCEERARRMAKRDLEKELRDGKGTGGSKKIDSSKRAHLQRKLDRKINDLSADRHRKKPSSS